MNKETEFLLKYAKIGVLHSMNSLDVIEKDELKTEFIRIKTNLTNSSSTNTSKEYNSGKKPSAVKKWFSGIGDRQREYKEKHKGEL